MRHDADRHAVCDLSVTRPATPLTLPQDQESSASPRKSRIAFMNDPELRLVLPPLNSLFSLTPKNFRGVCSFLDSLFIIKHGVGGRKEQVRNRAWKIFREVLLAQQWLPVPLESVQ